MAKKKDTPDDVQTTTTHEVVVAARSADEKWQFSGQTLSHLFTYTLTEHWNERMYAPYYVEFWKPLHDALDKRSKPTEIGLVSQYTFGVLPEERLRELMEEWRVSRKGNRPNFLSVTREEDGDQVSFSRLEITDISVEDASVE